MTPSQTPWPDSRYIWRCRSGGGGSTWCFHCGGGGSTWRCCCGGGGSTWCCRCGGGGGGGSTWRCRCGGGVQHWNLLTWFFPLLQVVLTCHAVSLHRPAVLSKVTDKLGHFKIRVIYFCAKTQFSYEIPSIQNAVNGDGCIALC